MKRLCYIVPLVLLLVLMSGCRSVRSVRKEKNELSEEQLIRTFMEAPPVTELTASLSLSLEGNKVNGQLRMRRGHSIQISASMLGLVEVARIEFLPDMVVVMDRVHSMYSVCHYADLPYRNELGLDFEVVQALFWNRVFQPGGNPGAVSADLSVDRSAADGSVLIREKEYGYTFVTDGKERLAAVSKTGTGFRFNMDYTDFTEVSGSWKYPLGLLITFNDSDSEKKVSVSMTSVSADKKSWPDRTQVARRMKQVTLDEMLEKLGL